MICHWATAVTLKWIPDRILDIHLSGFECSFFLAGGCWNVASQCKIQEIWQPFAVAWSALNFFVVGHPPAASWRIHSLEFMLEDSLGALWIIHVPTKEMGLSGKKDHLGPKLLLFSYHEFFEKPHYTPLLIASARGTEYCDQPLSLSPYKLQTKIYMLTVAIAQFSCDDSAGYALPAVGRHIFCVIEQSLLAQIGSRGAYIIRVTRQGAVAWSQWRHVSFMRMCDCCIFRIF